jgi:sulfite exporter TauE/SafE
VFAALLWALAQFAENLLAVTLDENGSFPCSLDQPKLAFSVATAGACLAAAAAFVLGLAGRPRLVVAAIAVEVVCAVTWIALGGLDAVGCAVGI